MSFMQTESEQLLSSHARQKLEAQQRYDLFETLMSRVDVGIEEKDVVFGAMHQVIENPTLTDVEYIDTCIQKDINIHLSDLGYGQFTG